MEAAAQTKGRAGHLDNRSSGNEVRLVRQRWLNAVPDSSPAASLPKLEAGTPNCSPEPGRFIHLDGLSGRMRHLHLQETLVWGLRMAQNFRNQRLRTFWNPHQSKCDQRNKPLSSKPQPRTRLEYLLANTVSEKESVPYA